MLLGRTPCLHGSEVNLFQLHFAEKIKTTIKRRKRREGTLPLRTETFSSERPFWRRVASSPISERLPAGTHSSFQAKNEAKNPNDRELYPHSSPGPAFTRSRPAPTWQPRRRLPLPGAPGAFRAAAGGASPLPTRGGGVRASRGLCSGPGPRERRETEIRRAEERARNHRAGEVGPPVLSSAALVTACQDVNSTEVHHRTGPRPAPRAPLSDGHFLTLNSERAQLTSRREPGRRLHPPRCSTGEHRAGRRRCFNPTVPRDRAPVDHGPAARHRSASQAQPHSSTAR